MLKGLAHSRAPAGFRRGAEALAETSARDPTPNRVRRFGQAAVLAREASADLKFIYAHFMHTPSSVALYASIMRGVEWGFSAHAKDIWKSPEWEKRDKLARADFGVTCTGLGAEHLRSLSADPAKLDLVYHGLDLSRFPPPPPPRPPRDGSGEPVTIISVGRLVEKKGYDLLLDALAKLPAALKWRFIHIGGGDLSRNAQGAGAKARAFRAHRMARLTRSERGHRGAARGRHLRAAFPHRQRRRPRRPAQRPDGGREPGTAHPVDQRLVHSRSSSRTASRASSSSLTPTRSPLALARMIADPRRPREMAAAARKRLVEELRHGCRHRPAGRPAGNRPGLDSPMSTIAFYAPMKPPDDPVPSGDRTMARALLQRWKEPVSATCSLISRLRSRDGDGDPAVQDGIFEAAEARDRAAFGRTAPDALAHLSFLLQGARPARAAPVPALGHSLRP